MRHATPFLSAGYKPRGVGVRGGGVGGKSQETLLHNIIGIVYNNACMSAGLDESGVLTIRCRGGVHTAIVR